MFSKEVVEFSAKGLDVLKAETKATEKAIDDLHKANKRLKQETRDGSWEKQARALATQRRELKGVREETEKLQRAQRLQAFQGQYGRGLGTAMHYGHMARGRLQQVAGGFSGLMGGVGGAFGVAGSLSVAGLAQRGFSGTAAAAKLDNAIERLSRAVASELMPAMEALTNTINKVNNAGDKVRSGKAGFGDYATHYGSRAAMVASVFGGLGVGYGFASKGLEWAGLGKLPSLSPLKSGASSGFSAARGGLSGLYGHASEAGLFSRASLLRSGPAAAIIGGGAYGVYGGISDARSLERTKSLRTGGSLSPDQYDKYRTLIDTARGIEDPKERIAFLERQKEQHAKQATYFGRKIQGMSALRQAFFGRESRQSFEESASRAFISGRLLEEAKGGKPLDIQGRNTGMMQVQGAGERRSASDLYEELAASAAKSFSANEPDDLKGDESDGKRESPDHGVLLKILGELEGIGQRMQPLLDSFRG